MKRRIDWKSIAIIAVGLAVTFVLTLALMRVWMLLRVYVPLAILALMGA